MKIIVLGGGRIGGALAEQLVNTKHEVTVVDQDSDCLRQLQKKIDLRVLTGHAAHPEVLQMAGAQEADALVAVTSCDEVNMVACQVAYKLFNTPRRVAHIRSQAYLLHQAQLFNVENIPVDQVITPEQLVTDHIYQLVAYPGATQLLSFAHGKIWLLTLHATADHPLVNAPLSRLLQQLAAIDVRIVAIVRKKQLLVPEITSVIEAGDKLLFMVAFEQLPAVIASWQCLEKPYRHKRLFIVGGGNIGAALAKRLEQTYSVKLIERDPHRAAELAAMLPQTIVFCGNVSDQALLLEEHVEQIDLFIAVTNDDEDNIMSAMLAKHLGAKKSLVLIQRSFYADVMQDGMIDLVVSPQQITITALMSQLRRVHTTTTVRALMQEAVIVELWVRDDPSTSPEMPRSVGQVVNQLTLPLGVTIVAKVQGDTCCIACDQTTIHAGDQLLLFLMDKKALRAVEQLFHALPSFEEA